MDEAPGSRAARLVADLRQLLTLKQHYYPEGGWGWVVLVAAVLVHILSHGMITSAGLFYVEIVKKFGPAETTGRDRYFKCEFEYMTRSKMNKWITEYYELTIVLTKESTIQYLAKCTFQICRIIWLKENIYKLWILKFVLICFRMAWCYVDRSGTANFTSHHRILSQKVNESDRRYGRSYHRVRMSLHLIRNTVPPTIFQVTLYCIYCFLNI